MNKDSANPKLTNQVNQQADQDAQQGQALDRISLLGLEFFGRHGVLDEEHALGARFIVDIEMWLDLQETPDSLEATVDYSRIYTAVADEVTNSRCRLIEVLARRIADRVLSMYASLERVCVRVHKPHAPIPGVFRDVFAEIWRRR